MNKIISMNSCTLSMPEVVDPCCEKTRLFLEMGPDPTRRDFFDPKGKKWKNLGFLGEIFTRPGPITSFLS